MNISIVVDTNENQCVNESFFVTKFAFLSNYSNLQNIYCICYILTFIFMLFIHFQTTLLSTFLVQQ